MSNQMKANQKRDTKELDIFGIGSLVQTGAPRDPVEHSK